MAKIKEIYLWIAFFIIVVAVAGYIRYFYQPTLALNVSFAGGNGNSFYPYQAVSAPIYVQNTGSSEIQNLSFGLYVNGTLARTYLVTIPVGKSVTVDYNFTPTSKGTLSMSVQLLLFITVSVLSHPSEYHAHMTVLPPKLITDTFPTDVTLRCCPIATALSACGVRYPFIHTETSACLL